MGKELLKQFLYTTFNASADEQSLISEAFEEVSVKKNDVLVSAGEVCRFVYFINHGALRALGIDEKGREATRYIAFEGEFMTSVISFINQSVVSESIEALESSDLLVVNHQAFRELLKVSTTWKDLYINQLEVAYSTSHWRLFSFLKMEAKERYQYLLETNPEIFRRASNRVVASYLGITQESLSRLKVKH